jgi:enamine deaminase RidA (YjgF/YER057c/UK114 family)
MRRPLLLLAATGGLTLAPSLGRAQAVPNFLRPSGLPPTNGYSHVVEVPAGNRLVIVSGQVPLDSQGNLVGGADFSAQAQQVFLNLRQALLAAGATFHDVVKLTFYVVDATKLPALRQVRDQFIDSQNPPASTLVEVRRLFRPDVLLEVEAIAALR